MATWCRGVARRDPLERGSARLRPGAARLILDLAEELRRTYPEQIMGIEGHTDADPVLGGQWRNNHELSVARAVMVYNTLVASTHFREEQLFVVGQGANRPVVSNATPEGKRRNQRIELVVYPERRGRDVLITLRVMLFLLRSERYAASTLL